MKVLVTDGDSRAALAVTRSLGRAGHEVIVGAKETPALAQSSRYCAGRVRYPDPMQASEDFVAFIAGAVSALKVEILLPITDISTILVAGHRDRFDPSCLIPCAAADVIDRAANKVDIVQTAEALGIPVPRYALVSGPDDVGDVDLGLPLVIKPWRSRVRIAQGWASTAVTYARSGEELARDLASRGSHEFPLLLQERIVGPGVGVFACYHDGRPVALFSHRRLRERPPWGGVSVLSESTALPPVATEYATRLLDAIGWQGVAMVEFKQDVRRGVPKLMEINGRFWGSLQLAVDAGVDFPSLLVQSVSSGQFAPSAPYSIGVRSRWLWGDVDALVQTLFGRNGRPDAAVARKGRALLEFARFWQRGLHYDNPKLYDIRPGVFETAERLRLASRSVRRLLKNGDRMPSAVKVDHTAASRPSATIRTRVVGSLAEVGLRPDSWNALAARADTNTVFQTHEWTRSWLEVFGDHYEPSFVVASDDSGIAGVAPLVIETRATERVVRFVGDGRADYCDLIAAGDKPEVVRALVNAVLDDDRWDVIELNNLPQHSRTVAAVNECSARFGYSVFTDDIFVCRTLMVAGHEEYASQIVDKPSLRRRENRLQRQGRLVCRDLMAAAEIEPYLDRFFAQHIARWGSAGGPPSLFLNAGNKRFYRRLTETLAASGWLLFSALELDDRPIAFHFGFDYNGTVTWYKPSFDVEYAPASPGLVMVRHLVAYTIANKRSELDFTIGDEEFKRRFTNCERRTVSVRIFRDSVRFVRAQARRRLSSALDTVTGRRATV